MHWPARVRLWSMTAQQQLTVRFTHLRAGKHGVLAAAAHTVTTNPHQV